MAIDPPSEIKFDPDTQTVLVSKGTMELYRISRSKTLGKYVFENVAMPEKVHADQTGDQIEKHLAEQKISTADLDRELSHLKD